MDALYRHLQVAFPLEKYFYVLVMALKKKKIIFYEEISYKSTFLKQLSGAAIEFVSFKYAFQLKKNISSFFSFSRFEDST